MPEPVRPPPDPAKVGERRGALPRRPPASSSSTAPPSIPRPTRYEALRRDPGDSRANTALGMPAHRGGAVRGGGGPPARGRRPGHRQLHPSPRRRAALPPGRGAAPPGGWSRRRGRLRPGGVVRGLETPRLPGPGRDRLREGRPGGGAQRSEESLRACGSSPRALDLRAALLRRAGRPAEAVESARLALRVDPLDHRAQHELALALAMAGRDGEARTAREGLEASLRGDPQASLEVAAESEAAGLLEDALNVLDRAVASAPDPERAFPLLHYHRAHCLSRLGKAAEAREAYRRAAAAPPDLCFPFRIEEIAILEEARRANPSDARAPYYLGCLLFDRDVRRALPPLEEAARLDPRFAPALRALGLARGHTGDAKGAAEALARAAALDPGDPRLLFELDAAAEAAGAPPGERLERLRAHQETAALRNDVLTREITLLTRMGRPGEALRHPPGPAVPQLGRPGGDPRGVGRDLPRERAEEAPGGRRPGRAGGLRGVARVPGEPGGGEAGPGPGERRRRAATSPPRARRSATRGGRARSWRRRHPAEAAAAAPRGGSGGRRSGSSGGRTRRGGPSRRSSGAGGRRPGGARPPTTSRSSASGSRWRPGRPAAAGSPAWGSSAWGSARRASPSCGRRSGWRPPTWARPWRWRRRRRREALAPEPSPRMGVPPAPDGAPELN